MPRRKQEAPKRAAAHVRGSSRGPRTPGLVPHFVLESQNVKTIGEEEEEEEREEEEEEEEGGSCSITSDPPHGDDGDTGLKNQTDQGCSTMLPRGTEEGGTPPVMIGLKAESACAVLHLLCSDGSFTFAFPPRPAPVSRQMTQFDMPVSFNPFILPVSDLADGTASLIGRLLLRGRVQAPPSRDDTRDLSDDSCTMSTLVGLLRADADSSPAWSSHVCRLIVYLGAETFEGLLARPAWEVSVVAVSRALQSIGNPGDIVSDVLRLPPGTRSSNKQSNVTLNATTSLNRAPGDLDAVEQFYQLSQYTSSVAAIIPDQEFLTPLGGSVVDVVDPLHPASNVCFS
ncbi:unnamed protein product [Pleuronectes platessa]|uniref:Uncharacterized protein n=1 Tax=Pleuronectes platessa TaxID=8262 RepID=A0A9N7V0B5_PLEPL|nr:unnamed protein product [Pleuronectes platessa]